MLKTSRKLYGLRYEKLIVSQSRIVKANNALKETRAPIDFGIWEIYRINLNKLIFNVKKTLLLTKKNPV